jgi:subtilisin family serine protease
MDHPLLAERIAAGYDFVDHDEKSWRTDLLGSGTCAASILAETETGTQEDLGTTGICPEAEIHMLKVMPGGHTGDLIEALDYCIAHGIDVASVAVGEQGPSFLLASKIQQARAAGMCIIAAAGDDAETVAYPAAFPDVVSVGALGAAAAFPAESHHASRMTEQPGPEGYFTAYDTEARALIDLYAPAVAVLGAAPGGGLTARDGTALAAAHAAGIAALIAISHPALRTSGGVRGVTKADLTGRLLVTGSRLVQVSTSGRVVCVPDASVVLGLSGGVAPAMSMPTPMPGSAQTYAIG